MICNSDQMLLCGMRIICVSYFVFQVGGAISETFNTVKSHAQSNPYGFFRQNFTGTENRIGTDLMPSIGTGTGEVVVWKLPHNIMQANFVPVPVKLCLNKPPHFGVQCLGRLNNYEIFFKIILNLTGRPTCPVWSDRLIDTSDNITFPQTTYACGNNIVRFYGRRVSLCTC